MNQIIMLPPRYAPTRLPGKPMIVAVCRRATKADLALVGRAADTLPLAEAIEAVGGRAVLASPEHPSGTDRISEALTER